MYCVQTCSLSHRVGPRRKTPDQTPELRQAFKSFGLRAGFNVSDRFQNLYDVFGKPSCIKDITYLKNVLTVPLDQKEHQTTLNRHLTEMRRFSDDETAIHARTRIETALFYLNKNFPVEYRTCKNGRISESDPTVYNGVRLVATNRLEKTLREDCNTSFPRVWDTPPSEKLKSELIQATADIEFTWTPEALSEDQVEHLKTLIREISDLNIPNKTLKKQVTDFVNYINSKLDANYNTSQEECKGALYENSIRL